MRGTAVRRFGWLNFAAVLAAGALGVSHHARAGTSPDEDQWVRNGRDAGGSYYSPLTDIDRHTVSRLGFEWDYPLGTKRGLEATPLVIDGALYAVGNWGRVYSVDAATGKERWRYDPQVDGQWGRYACCDVVNRGLAESEGTIYVGALDGFLHAIDARTGMRRWKVDTLIGRGRRLPYTLTGAPVIAGDLVVIGNAGADFKGVRGYVSAYDLKSGALRWRFFTVPRDPKLGPQDQPHLVAAIQTWDPRHRWEYGGGGTVWDGMSYDAESNLLYIGTGNASPYTIKEHGRRGGDDLYANCIVAIHADTGRMAWYYQIVPGDEWDYDATQKMILADLTLEGGVRKVLMQASKDGFFYVLDRMSGEFISAQNFAYVNWTKRLDPKTGRPQPNPDAEYLAAPRLIFPSMAGAHSWQPMSYDPATGLVYIPALEAPMVYIETANRPAGLIEGNFTVAGLFAEDFDPESLSTLFGPLPTLDELAHDAPKGAAHSVGVLKAWNPTLQKLVWQRPSATFWNGGVLSTAGGIVVQGDAAGFLNVYDAASGELLKALDVGTSIMAAPMTYRVAGKQYIAVMAGYGGGPGLYSPFPPASAAYRFGNEGRIVAFALDGAAPPMPPPVTEAPFAQPPPRTGTAQAIAHGEVLYSRYCGRCHVFGRGELPDLRRLAAATHTVFYDIVLRGIYAARGMGRFDDVLSRQDASDLHAFLVERAWDAYRHQRGAEHP